MGVAHSGGLCTLDSTVVPIPYLDNKSKRNVKVVKVNRSRDVPASVTTEKVSHHCADRWNADSGGTREHF